MPYIYGLTTPQQVMLNLKHCCQIVELQIYARIAIPREPKKRCDSYVRDPNQMSLPAINRVMLRVLRLNGFGASRLERQQRRDPESPPTIGPFVLHHGGAAEQLLGDLRSASVPGWAPLFDANVLSERVSTGTTVTAGRWRLSFTGVLTAGQ